MLIYSQSLQADAEGAGDFRPVLGGRNGKEIRDVLCISENTLKYHNKHIYETLNVSSRKELLHYAAMLEKEAVQVGGRLECSCSPGAPGREPIR